MGAKLIDLVLEAMKRGSTEARDLFPKLLQLLDNTELAAVFKVNNYKTNLMF